MVGTLVALALGAWMPVSLTPFQLVLLVILFPLLEEIVFRGLVQPLIARHWRARWQQLSLANMATSALFALAHVASRGPSPLTVGVFIPSLLFGHAAESNRGKLGAPIAMHMAFNAGFFLPGLIAH
ncbi:abortive infection protein [Simiduia agarivorans SA1 = DSM 21679]|uniref:Abortive infection protein n=1 Tax=Simiduia agarivorans (strain DSM 21679 / JCM 13881 / BCRC 17597 / SA1) TaxID=1117647 RepID=K4KLK9_SIMAS|nr:abortive infection protein [Simiduia agarivorans SA1 = DSM 21679]